MGGKKGPEKNRKYEKDRRDRLNDQFNELNKLLPDFNSSAMKFSKAEIINRTIQYLKDTQSHKLIPPENKSNDEVSENKICELQKKVAGLLQIIKELVKLLHKSNINFPASLPIDDFKAFKDAYTNCKRMLKDTSDKENKKRKTSSENSSEDVILPSGNESIETEDEEKIEDRIVTTASFESVSVVSSPSTSVPQSQTGCKTQIMSLKSSNILHVDPNPVIIPQGNVLTVNGLPNALLNSVNTSPTILLNKPVTVPTLILMQNNIVPATSMPQIRAIQEKLIVPKPVLNTTNTTFMNKKPIPAVRPYKSIMPLKDSNEKVQLMKRKRSRRSKGILVKYPKRKPPSKNKEKEQKLETAKEMRDPPTEDSADKRIENTKVESCSSNSFPQNNNDIDKNYTDNLFDTQIIQNTGPFIDFFENPSRNVNSESSTNDVGVVSACVENTITSEPSDDCNLIDSETSKEPVKQSETIKNVGYLSPKSYVSAENMVSESTILDKRKSTEKEISPLSIQCNLDENKSVAKDLNLTFDDKAKHYEPSFDEFSNDLFLHVPSSGHHTDSISPTAAFLSNFPLVSSLKHTDLLPEHEEDSNTTPTNSTTILQIGNLESPSTLLFTNKNIPSRDTGKNAEKVENYTFCNTTTEIDHRADKKKDCKEATPRDIFNLDTFVSQPAKNPSCSKDVLTQNMHLYPTSTSSSFSTYSRLTKYNDIPVVTSSYYNFSSPPTFPSSKTSSDLVTDYNSWMPTYNQDDPNKEKKRDKSMSATFRNTFGLQVNETSSAERAAKLKKPKQTGSRALVNWMTSPDSRNTSETLQPFSDIFSSTKDDTTVSSIGFLNSPNVQNTANFTSYSTTDYFLDNQSFSDTQLTNKMTYSSTNPTSYSWSPSKTALPALSMDTPSIMIPSTLPTLVGDLALGNSTFNNFESIPKKGDTEKKKNCQKTSPQNASSFFSVTQLVDGKSMSKKSNETCLYDENRDKCFKENYSANKINENVADFKKTYPSSTYKENPKNHFKCRKETAKCNNNSNQANRCLSKENKKDNRLSQKTCEYSSQSCQMVTDKDANPLSNKNSNYSAEALIGSNNHSNTCSTQNYFSYDNSANYNNCTTNKKLNEADSLTNVGYYPNTNYMYANNFQTFNNYSLSNQYCNNYSSQMQQSSVHKKKDDGPQTKQDASWYKDNFSSYSSIVPSEFASQQKEKYKQPFSNKYNCAQKSSTMYNSYYQYGSSSAPSNHSKSSCNFNSTSHSFSQAGQQCPVNNYQSTGYDMKLNRNVGLNTNNVVPPTTLTNFNLSTIIPEINDKHCMQSRVTAAGNEKNNFKYGAGGEINYNYLIQPTSETNSESTSVYSSSSFQVSHYPDFVSRRHQK